MIAVFLSGVLVGGLVVYMSPNNGLSSGMSGGHQGGQTGAGGQGGGGPAGGQANGAAQAATPSGDVGSTAGGGAAGATGGGAAAGGATDAASGGAAGATTGGGGASEMSGPGPGAQGSMESSAMGGASGGVMGTGGGGQEGGMGGGGQGGSMGGAEGGGDSSSPISPVPVSGAPQGATRLLRHLQIAPTLWKAQAEAALQSKDSKIRALAGDIAAHAAAVPTVTDRLPQTPNVVSYLVDSKLLLERMKAAGMDVGSLETQVDEVSRARK
ncbi:hypothetical protein LBMAG42_49600 [Deltaproteobacteria bacterium]|nr:hypothetical protein LBMAG42_49600 [Deltaproteobacteria bacterium]